jgi:hypothetical protein
MDQRLGMTNPLFPYELALELGMTVGELHYGRGTPMSAHELTVGWPAFFRWRQSDQERREKAEQAAPRPRKVGRR